MQPFVSIITVNYNQVQATCEFIESTRQLNYREFEIIVVDNGSKEDPKIIQEKYPDVNLIISDKNLGFAGGNNLGINAALGDYLFFVNNDVELSPTTLEAMISRFEKDDDIGMVSPKIKFFHHPDTIQYAGYTEINPYTARNRTIGKYEKDEGQYDVARITHYGHGAAMMVKRETLKRIGLMPEEFFLYYEEMDWCEQIKRAGFKIYYEPEAVVYHKESLSVGKKNALKTYYMTRNRILFMRRNASLNNFLIFLMFFIFFSIPKFMFFSLIKRDTNQLKSFLRGLRWHFSEKNLNTLKKPAL